MRYKIYFIYENNLGSYAEIVQKLGEGGQGVVYRVKVGGKAVDVSLYLPDKSSNALASIYAVRANTAIITRTAITPTISKFSVAPILLYILFIDFMYLINSLNTSLPYP